MLPKNNRINKEFKTRFARVQFHESSVSEKFTFCIYTRLVLKKFAWAFRSHDTWLLAKPVVLYVWTEKETDLLSKVRTDCEGN